jgi:triacylglycerol lipase
MLMKACKDLVTEVNLDTNITFNKDTVQGFTKVVDNILYIVFRGSDSAEDWKTNFEFSKKIIPYDNMGKSKIRIHGGWITAYKAIGIRDVILKAVFAYIESLSIYSNAKIIVIGHSYGAALTEICALDIEYNIEHSAIYNVAKDNVYCIPLSPPRVGNYYFKKSFQKRICHHAEYYCGADIVHHVPPFLFGFIHINHMHHFGKRKIFSVIWNTIKGLSVWIYQWITGKSINLRDLYMCDDHDPVHFSDDYDLTSDLK